MSKRCVVLSLGLTILVAHAQSQEQPSIKQQEKATRLDRLGDPLPPGAVARFGSLRLRHAGEAHLAFTPDGQKLVSVGTMDNVLQVWSAETGKELRRYVKVGLSKADLDEIWMRGQLNVASRYHFRDESLPPLSVGFSPDGNLMITVPRRDMAILWNTVSGTEVHRFPLLYEQGHAVAFSADGKNVAVGDCGDETLIRVWDVQSGKEIKKLKGLIRVSRLAFSPDGTYLAAVESTQARLWHLSTGKRVRVYQGHAGAIHALAFSPDSKRLATCGRDYTLRIWETDSEEEVTRFVAADVPVLSAAFSPDGTSIVSGSHDNVLRLWDIASGRLTRSFEGHSSSVASVTFAPNGKTLASADHHGTLRLWDVASGKDTLADLHAGQVQSVGFAAETGEVFLSTDTGATSVGRVSNGQIVRRFAKPDMKSPNLCLSPDGKILIWMDPDNGNLHAWGNSEGKELYKLEGQYHGLISFAQDSRHFALAAGDDNVRIWDAATGREVRRLQRSGAVSLLAFSPDGKTLAALTRDEICLWELASGQKRGRFPASNSLSGLVFSPDSRFLAGGGHDETIRVWDTWSGKLVRGFVGHHWAVNAIAFSPDGKLLVSGGEDSSVRLWDVKSGDELRRFKGHRGGVNAVAFATDGKQVISGSRDTTALVWDLRASAGAIAVVDAKARQFEKLWHDLGHDDAGVAFEAVSGLAALGKESLPLLQTRLQPVPRVKDNVIMDLIADLDDGRFSVRDKATRMLEKLEGQAAAAIKKALAGTPSAEATKRLQTLADRLDAPLADMTILRSVRALDVLDRIGSVEARDLLQALAQGAPGARLTLEAHGVWHRVSKRLAKSP
jgi:WD40 repeat protein